MCKVLLAAAMLWAAIPLQALADDDISGTYKLVVDQRKIVDTGEVVEMPNPHDYIMYDKGGRMMVVIVRHPRPRPESSDKVTDQERIDLYKSLSAYGGTYKFDGKTVQHSVDIAWNEVWVGSKQLRTVTRDGDRLILTTPQYRFANDGKMSVNVLVWEKIK